MPGHTSPRSYPYPLDSDPINVAGDMQALANAIDDDVTSSLVGKLNTAGGTVTGSLTVNGNEHVKGTMTVDGSTIINDNLTVIAPTTGGIYLSDASNVPGIHIRHYGATTEYASFKIAANDLHIESESEMFLRAHGHNVMSFINPFPIMVIGKLDLNLANPGIEIYAGGTGLGRVTSIAGNKLAYSNLILRHVGGTAGMDADTRLFCLFQHGTTGVTLGSITQSGTAGVKYNTTCDYRLKDDLGPVVDAVAKVMALQPKELRAKSDLQEFEGFIAHEVAEVAPYAVTGEKDAVKPDDDEFDPGGILAQQLDYSRLVPLLTAALQDALTRIAALEAAP